MREEDVPRIEANAATLKYAIPFSVRGIVKTKQITAETIAQTTEHDAPFVTRYGRCVI